MHKKCLELNITSLLALHERRDEFDNIAPAIVRYSNYQLWNYHARRVSRKRKAKSVEEYLKSVDRQIPAAMQPLVVTFLENPEGYLQNLKTKLQVNPYPL